MKKTASLIIALLAITFITSSATASNDAQGNEPSDAYMALVDEASAASRKGEWSRADTLLCRAMEMQPGLPTNILLLSNLGMIRFYAGNDSLAIATLTDAHLQAPHSVTILQNRAKVLSYTGRHDQAYDDYTAIIHLDSTVVEPHFHRAILSLRRSDIATATHDIDRLKALAPASPLTLEAEAYLNFAQNQYAPALSLLNPLIEKSPTPDLMAVASFCHLMLGNLAEASDLIGRGLQSEPTHAELHLYRALLNKMRFRPDDARTDAIRAIQLGVSAERAEALIGSDLSKHANKSQTH